MRNAFIRGLTALAERDPRVVLLTGDLGFKIFDDFAARFPGRFYNAGVAEANMMSVAGGLALGGLRPFAYSIVPFATLRCLEQIRERHLLSGGPRNRGGRGRRLQLWRQRSRPTTHSKTLPLCDACRI